MGDHGPSDDENKIFIGGLPWSADDRTLRDEFKEFGDIVDAKVVTDRETGRSRGFGFVTFGDRRAADDAVAKMDGRDLDGRSVSVKMAQPRGSGPRRDGGGGCYQCGEPGHFARECPTGGGGGRGGGMGGGGGRGGGCYQCGESGHFARDCPTGGGGGGSRGGGYGGGDRGGYGRDSYSSGGDRGGYGRDSYSSGGDRGGGYGGGRESSRYDPYARSSSPRREGGGYDDRSAPRSGGYDDRAPSGGYGGSAPPPSGGGGGGYSGSDPRDDYGRPREGDYGRDSRRDEYPPRDYRDGGRY